MTKPHENYALDPKPLGSGGQAEVFRAKDKRTGQFVALKRLFRPLRADSDAVARMRREVDVQTNVKHPNVMPVLDWSRAFYWYTMPLASTTLGRLPTPIDQTTLFQAIRDCAKGLEAAHAFGFTHRDVTPNNILQIFCGGDHRWVISDWGLVRRHGQTSVVRTPAGQPLGTLGFAAPEMWQDAHAVDARADVYSLGRVVAWALTGTWPSPNIPLVPKGEWQDFVLQTTAMDRATRVQDMATFVAMMDHALSAPAAGQALPLPNLDEKPLPGLTPVDTALFKAICKVSLAKGTDWITVDQISDAINALHLTQEAVTESIVILADNYYVQWTPTLGSGFDLFQVTTHGFEQYASVYMPEFPSLLNKVLLAIVEQGAQDNSAVAALLGQPLILINYALDILADEGLILTAKYLGGGVSVHEVTAKGRRTAMTLVSSG